MIDTFRGWYYTAAEWCSRLCEAQMGRLQSKRIDGQGGYLLSVAEVWREAETTRLFVLDELGLRANPTDAQFDAIHTLLDKRERRPLVCISNLSLDELAATYDHRIAARLAEGTHVVFKKRLTE
jgi:DNA replication protein DnaC